MSVWNAILPVVTLLIGLLISTWAQERRDKRQDDRDEAKIQRAREVARLDRRETFELANLTAVHEALRRVSRAASLFHSADVKLAKATGRLYGASLVGDDDLDEEVRLANAELHTLSGLIFDDAIREQVVRSHVRLGGVGMPPVPLERAEVQWLDASMEITGLFGVIAARIRDLYSVPGGPSISSVSQSEGHGGTY